MCSVENSNKQTNKTFNNNLNLSYLSFVLLTETKTNTITAVVASGEDGGGGGDGRNEKKHANHFIYG